TSVNRDHHHASGFDQAKDVDRAGHCKLMIAPRVTELTLDRSNSVTQTAARPRQKSVVCWLAGRERAGLWGTKRTQPRWLPPLSAFGAKRSCMDVICCGALRRLARRDNFPRRRIWWQSDRSGHRAARSELWSSQSRRSRSTMLALTDTQFAHLAIAAVALGARAGRRTPSSYACGPQGASVISFTSWLITSGRNFEANPSMKSLFANTAAQCPRRSPSSLNFQMCTS